MLERWMEGGTSPFEQLEISTEAYFNAVKVTEEIEMELEKFDSISSKRVSALLEACGTQCSEAENAAYLQGLRDGAQLFGELAGILRP